MGNTRRAAFSAFALLLIGGAPVHAAPLAGARYYGAVADPEAGRIAVGVTPTADRQWFEPSGPREWQGSHVVASRSLPCVGRREWSVAGQKGTHVTGSTVTVGRAARNGTDRLRLRVRFAKRRAFIDLVLRSARRGGCVFRTRFVAHVTRRLQGTCTPPRTATLARSASGRIFAQTDADDLGGRTRNAYGCLFGVRKRFFLNQHESPDDYVAAAATAGSLGAIARYVCPTDCGGSVEIVDLATGQGVRRDDIAPMCNQPTTQPPEVTSLVLAPSGSYAYIARGYFTQPPAVNDVVKNVAGNNTLLDCGTAIAPRSLSLSGSMLSWLNSGEPRTAPLD